MAGDLIVYNGRGLLAGIPYNKTRYLISLWIMQLLKYRVNRTVIVDYHTLHINSALPTHCPSKN